VQAMTRSSPGKQSIVERVRKPAEQTTAHVAMNDGESRRGAFNQVQVDFDRIKEGRGDLGLRARYQACASVMSRAQWAE